MISAIVLAAGFSSRMKTNKLDLQYGFTTVLQHVIFELVKSKVDEIIVVTSKEEIIEGVKSVINPHPEKGMTSSIKIGVEAASDLSKGYMVCLADMVKLNHEDYNSLVDQFNKNFPDNPSCIVIPRFNGEKGNPAIFSSKYKSEILDHKDPEGCKGIIKQHPDQIVWIDMNNDAVLVDMDTPEDYDRLSHGYS
ncbi:MAG: nucleotidyltransferase family protein [Flavitalea sp.]